MSGPLLVDGHNLVHAILARGNGPIAPEEFTRTSARVARLLSTWAQLRQREVVLVWDRGAARSRFDGLSQLHVDGPAEADDALVLEASRRAGLGQKPAVATRDAELLLRLPAVAERFPVEQLIRDLAAIESDPIALTHLTGAAGRLERLPQRAGFPRRRDLFRAHDAPSEEPRSPPTATRTAPNSEREPGAELGPQSRAQQKDQRRARWLRARSRTKR
jgi:hypothetical protein